MVIDNSANVKGLLNRVNPLRFKHMKPKEQKGRDEEQNEHPSNHVGEPH